jgi:hypothetical protein
VNDFGRYHEGQLIKAKQAALMTNLLLAAFAWPSAGAAELASRADQPYRILVALHFSDDAAFTPAFANSVERQVRDQTRNLFGPLAEVEVATEHPLIERLRAAGMEAFSLRPDEFAPNLTFGDRPCDKVFLFDVDFRGRVYHLAWRQLDGDVEQLGPLRSRETPDRQWVAKAVALAIQEDFAPVARVLPTVERNKVQLEFRGSLIEKGRPLSAWLGDDCILQPYWVVQQADGSLARVALPYTVLRVEHGDGGSGHGGGGKWARVITNLPNPWLQSARVVGFQACKLHTQSGRFRLRLVDRESGAPVQNCAVYASDRGFEAIDDASRLADPDARGYVVVSRPFEHLAYLRISQGAGPGIQLPLPITADWCELTCQVAVDEGAAERNDLERQTGYLVEDLKALQAGLSDRVREVNRLNADKRYEEALRATRGALSYGEKYSASASKSQRVLRERRERLKLAPNPALAWLEKESQELAVQQSGLETLAENLERIIQRNDAQSRANVLIELSAQAERNGDIDQAIDKYVLALGEQPEQPAVEKRLAQLKAAWQTKSPAHRQARRFIYEIWNKIDLPGLESQLPEAERAFSAVQSAGDFLASGKLLKINERLVSDIDRLVRQLADRDGEADRQEHEKYVALLERLAKFQQSVAEFYGAASSESGLTSKAGSSGGVAKPLEASEPATMNQTPGVGGDAGRPLRPPAGPKTGKKDDEDQEEPPLPAKPPAASGRS